MNLNILIGEDEVLIAEHLSDIVQSFDYNVVGIGHKKEDILQLIDATKPDIALLDIRMIGKYDGVEIGEYILNNYNFPVIYITAHSDKDIIHKALKTKPSGYIIKPFTPMDVYTALNIAVEKFEKSNAEKYLLIKDGYKDVKLHINDIFYICSDNNYVEIHTKEKKYLERNSLEKVSERINSEDFIKVHRSYVVNLSHASELSGTTLMVNKEKIPVSRSYLKNVKSGFILKNS